MATTIATSVLQLDVVFTIEITRHNVCEPKTIEIDCVIILNANVTVTLNSTQKALTSLYKYTALDLGCAQDIFASEIPRIFKVNPYSFKTQRIHRVFKIMQDLHTIQFSFFPNKA